MVTIYNQAFDLYHSIYRVLQFLNKIDDDKMVEIDRMRIWDFYLLFPNKVHDIRLKQNEKEINRLRREYIKYVANPYESIREERKIFEKLKPYQIAAINCIGSYGIIDKKLIVQQRIKITNRAVLNEFIARFEPLQPKERNVISLMTSHFFQLSIYGTDGLKSRTKLMESKYDA